MKTILLGAVLALAIATPAEARTCKVQGLVNADCSIVVPPIPPANPPPLPPPASQRIVPQPKYWRS